MITRIAAFTHRGVLIAQDMQKFLNVNDNDISFFNKEDFSGNELHTWVNESFLSADRIVFIGAVQIAVRLIAKELKSKLSDPAVVVIDDNARYCIPILSGHIGMANEFALEISRTIGAEPIITTATDINNKFAVDVFARKNNLEIINPEKIKSVSSKILSEHTIVISSDCPILGEVPSDVIVDNRYDCDVYISPFLCENDSPIMLVPNAVSIGIGCKKNTDSKYLKDCYYDFLSVNRISHKAISRFATIDLKRDETAIINLGRETHIPIEFFSAIELNNVSGAFSKSDFVKSITGVDNVCERSALINFDGEIFIKKSIYNGVTFAAAIKFLHLNFGE